MASTPICIFDLDGTLIDSLGCIVVSANQTFAAHGLPERSREDIVKWVGVPLERSLSLIQGTEFKGQQLAALIDTYRAAYRAAAAQHLRLFGGIADLLADLGERGTRMGVATSKKTAIAIENLEQLGVLRHLPVVIGADMVTRYKPDPESVHRTLEGLRGHTSDTVVVGDTSFDIEMGRAAGCRTIGVTWGSHDDATLRSAGADEVAGSVEALAALLR